MDEVRWFPLFRTDVQFRLLAELFTNPGLEATVGGLAERVGAPQATVSRQVAPLADGGMVGLRREAVARHRRAG
ncbi:MAG: helix-turn-helix domain-containing protein, partial [Egibacteraceae bacterium]